MASGPGRLVKTRGPRHGLGGAAHVETHILWAATRPGPSDFEMMSRGPARSIRFRDDGPWPRPAHQISWTLVLGPARSIMF